MKVESFISCQVEKEIPLENSSIFFLWNLKIIAPLYLFPKISPYLILTTNACWLFYEENENINLSFVLYFNSVI